MSHIAPVTGLIIVLLIWLNKHRFVSVDEPSDRMLVGPSEARRSRKQARKARYAQVARCWIKVIIFPLIAIIVALCLKYVYERIIVRETLSLGFFALR